MKKIEDLIQEGCYVSSTVGVSMYPLLRNRRDTIYIRPVQGRLKKYDVPLYKRGDKYVLHRIIKVLPNSYVICGDNCIQKEYDISDEQIIGVLSECYRGDKKLNLNGFTYKLYSRIWVAIYPLRKAYKLTRGYLGRIYHKLFSKK